MDRSISEEQIPYWVSGVRKNLYWNKRFDKYYYAVVAVIYIA